MNSQPRSRCATIPRSAALGSPLSTASTSASCCRSSTAADSDRQCVAAGIDTIGDIERRIKGARGVRGHRELAECCSPRLGAEQSRGAVGGRGGRTAARVDLHAGRVGAPASRTRAGVLMNAATLSPWMRSRREPARDRPPRRFCSRRKAEPSGWAPAHRRGWDSHSSLVEEDRLTFTCLVRDRSLPSAPGRGA
jgi:hypothetical protein